MIDITTTGSDDHWERIGNGAVAIGDCRQVLKTMESASVDCVLADPPYNYEFIGKEWDHAEIRRRLDRVKDAGSSTLVKHVPYGSGLAGGKRDARWYEKNQRNAREYSEWTESWAEAVFRVCKPGAYVGVFNATRFIGRVQVALENVGFYPRDVLVMEKLGGIPRGLNAVKAMEKRGVSDAAEVWKGYHSALRNQWEALILVQKPLDTNYLTTLSQYGTGLMRAETTAGFRTNIVERLAHREPRIEAGDIHATPKPLGWIEYLLDLLMPPNSGAVVLDPFLGTGTTAVAAERLGLNWLGIDMVAEYVELSRRRLREELSPDATARAEA